MAAIPKLRALLLGLGALGLGGEPLVMTGSARGSSTVRSVRRGRVPIAFAASFVFAGTESRPSTVFRSSTTSV